jgi:hypothetical protein
MELIRTCLASLASLAPYSQSRMHDTAEVEKEDKDDYDARTWRERCTVDAQGLIAIPGFAFKMALDKAAQRRADKVGGKGNATYTKHFVGGVLVDDKITIGPHKNDVECGMFHCHANGKRGSGSRVWRRFPVVPSWQADVVFTVLDAQITPEIFEQTLREAGYFVGIGRFRPENGGTNGRFKVVETVWAEKNIAEVVAA